jgi:hypothetical protein
MQAPDYPIRRQVFLSNSRFRIMAAISDNGPVIIDIYGTTHFPISFQVYLWLSRRLDKGMISPWSFKANQ